MTDEGYLQSKIRELHEKQISIENTLKGLSLSVSKLERIIESEIQPKLKSFGPPEDLFRELNLQHEKLWNTVKPKIIEVNNKAIKKAFEEYRDFFEKGIAKEFNAELDHAFDEIKKNARDLSVMFSIALSKGLASEKQINELIKYAELPENKRAKFRKTRSGIKIIGNSPVFRR